MIINPRVGMRVRVTLRGTHHGLHCSAEAVALFDGRAGSVAVIEPENDMCLVAFDKPVYTANPRAGGCFDGPRVLSRHFNFGELEELPIETRCVITSCTDSTAENLAGIIYPCYSDEVLRVADVLLLPFVPPSDVPLVLHVEKPRNAPLVCPACEACLLEDQLSTAEVPHPIDSRVHTCAEVAKKQYVLGFYFDCMLREVLLINKFKPAWQAGKWNGIGGRVERGETPEAAMRREFAEEAGVEISTWRKFATIETKEADTQISVFYAVQHPTEANPRGCTVEPIDWAIVEGVISGVSHATLANTGWLILMALRIIKRLDSCTSYLVQEVATR